MRGSLFIGLVEGVSGCERKEPLTSTIADDEYAEEDFSVEDAADSDEYADKDFENLVKQFRVDEKMCYYPLPRWCGLLLFSIVLLCRNIYPIFLLTDYSVVWTNVNEAVEHDRAGAEWTILS
eukprot:Em0015g640a